MYGLIGFPLGHSFSRRYFTEKFIQEGIDDEYRLFPLEDIGQLPQLLAGIPGLTGFNVTIPYKKHIMGFLDSVSDAAASIGAVNCVKIRREDSGRPVLEGHNTDWNGFLSSLKPLLESRLPIEKALVLGSGGAAASVRYALESIGIVPQIVSRAGKASGNLDYRELDRKIVEESRLVVNATPAGMWPAVDTAPPFPYQWLSPAHICHDLVYNPETTLFMKKSADFGAVVKNGMDMLYAQADLSWEIWQR